MDTLKTYFLIVILILVSHFNFSQETKQFATVKELIAFAKETNVSLLNASLQLKLAELTTKSSYVNIFNPVIPTSATAIDNIKQQVSFLPGQIFGQPAGTYKSVTMGQRYATTFNVQPQFDILNLGSIAQVQTAKINSQLVVNQNKLNEQEIYSNINAIYFNILSFNAQVEMLNEQIKNAEQIQSIVQNKYNQGIARKQELNEAEVNMISLKDKLEQVKLNLEMQFQNLNLILENEFNVALSENLWSYNKNSISPAVLPNNLLFTNATLQRELAAKELSVLKFQHAPVLSFISSMNYQNLSNVNFFAANSDWINFSYVGLKVRYDFPTTTQRYSSLRSKQIQLEVLKNNENHFEKQTDNANKLLELEMQKSIAQKSNFEKILALKEDTYNKNLLQFEEGVLSLDKMLISQSDLIISKLNMISALATVGFTQTKIDINNDL